MKFKYVLPLALGLTAFTFGQQHKVFDSRMAKNYFINSEIINVEGERVYVEYYDFFDRDSTNINWDVVAYFHTRENANIEFWTEAFMLGVDTDGDKKLDEIYIDRDLNGTLETKLEKKVIKKS